MHYKDSRFCSVLGPERTNQDLFIYPFTAERREEEVGTEEIKCFVLYRQEVTLIVTFVERLTVSCRLDLLLRPSSLQFPAVSSRFFVV